MGSLADAKDIVQEVWVNVLAARALDKITNIRAYLFKAARNTARNWRAKTHVRQAYLARERPVAIENYVGPLEHTTQHGQEFEELLRRLGRLSPKAQSALLLIRGEGLTMEEAARELGMTPKAVQKLTERAIRQLMETVPLLSLGSRGKER